MSKKLESETPVEQTRLVRRCVLHHFACDCREAAFAELLKDVMQLHADPNGAQYNGCDTDPCAWCQEAERLMFHGHPDATNRMHAEPDPPAATGTEARVCADIAERQRLGIVKYGTTVERSKDDMLRHAYEEALDLSVYLRAELDRRARADATVPVIKGSPAERAVPPIPDHCRRYADAWNLYRTALPGRPRMELQMEMERARDQFSTFGEWREFSMTLPGFKEWIQTGKLKSDI